jgi:hypothetical protein
MKEWVERTDEEYREAAEKTRDRALGESDEPDPEEVEQTATSVPMRWFLQWEDGIHRQLGIYFKGNLVGKYEVEIGHRGGEPLKRSLMKAIQQLEAQQPYEYGAGWVNFWDWYWHVKNSQEVEA